MRPARRLVQLRGVEDGASGRFDNIQARVASAAWNLHDAAPSPLAGPRRYVRRGPGAGGARGPPRVPRSLDRRAFPASLGEHAEPRALHREGARRHRAHGLRDGGLVAAHPPPGPRGPSHRHAGPPRQGAALLRYRLGRVRQRPGDVRYRYRGRHGAGADDGVRRRGTAAMGRGPLRPRREVLRDEPAGGPVGRGGRVPHASVPDAPPADRRGREQRALRDPGACGRKGLDTDERRPRPPCRPGGHVGVGEGGRGEVRPAAVEGPLAGGQGGPRSGQLRAGPRRRGQRPVRS